MEKVLAGPPPHLIFQAAVKLAGFEQAEISRVIYKSPATVSRYLSGERFPRDIDLWRLCALLGLEPREMQRLHEIEALALATPEAVLTRPESEIASEVTRYLPSRPPNWSKDPMYARHVQDDLDGFMDVYMKERGWTAGTSPDRKAPGTQLATMLEALRGAAPGRWRSFPDPRILWELQAAAAAGTSDAVLDLACDVLGREGEERPARDRVGDAIAEATAAVAFYRAKKT